MKLECMLQNKTEVKSNWLSKPKAYWWIQSFSKQRDSSHQWNLRIKQKANQYSDQSYSVCVGWVFLKDFTKHVDRNTAPKTLSIINIDMLFYLNNAYM